MHRGDKFKSYTLLNKVALRSVDPIPAMGLGRAGRATGHIDRPAVMGDYEGLFRPVHDIKARRCPDRSAHIDWLLRKTARTVMYITRGSAPCSAGPHRTGL